MGRKAKLKKVRKMSLEKGVNHSKDPDKFVENLERQGYSLKNPKMSPGVPEKKIDPQV